MRTYLDCIPCFIKSAIEMARLVDGNEIRHKEIVDDVARLIPEFSLGCSPPEMARMIYKAMARRYGDIDFYKNIKKQSNRAAMALYPRLKEKVRTSQDRLLTAVEIAIAGNVIDYAAKNTLNIEKEIEKIFTKDFNHINKTVFDYEAFKAELDKSKRILYLADNAGEIVFDRVFIEEIPFDKDIILAVRDKPVINDALIEDAQECGLDKRAKVMSSGVDAPGTVLKYCSKEFIETYKSADIIISKGQGNYEALSQERENIFFLFRAKCPVIARHAQVALGDIVLKSLKMCGRVSQGISNPLFNTGMLKPD
ncbi:MAG: ARMT1-like domain-containing protein [Candidatus Omnitrophica bacterium]|nr:ARMT1-like domain-containing protein [Candidatus Omnitrophota bacterium]